MALVSTNDRVRDLARQLDDHPYELMAGELIRFRASAKDDVFSGIVRAVIVEGEDGRHQFRQTLTEPGADSLRLFAMRSTLLARRSSSLARAYEALDGFALLPTTEDVPWESWLKAALFIVRALGGHLPTTARRFEEVASVDAMARFDVALDALNRVESLAQCHIAEVTTTYGVGFVEILIFRDTPTWGLGGAPRGGDNRVAYQPATNVAQLTVNLADAIDALGVLTCGPISQDQLAASSFSLSAPGSYLAVDGCLSFVATFEDARGSLTVYACELPEGTDAGPLAAAANLLEEQVAAGENCRLVLMSAQPSFDEDVEVVVDWAPLALLVRSALTGVASI